jgi:DNA repair protein RadC
MQNHPIHSWPEDCRPREKLLSSSASTLSDAELLALFIRTGIQGLSALDLAREMLRTAGSLRGLLALDWERAKKIRGIGPARYSELQGAIELGKRCLQQSMKRGDLVRSDASATALIQATLQDQKVEVFISLSLDSQLRLIALDEIARGSINEVSVSPRLVVEKALQRGASGVIVAHNHPSGVSEPSQSDIQFTKKLRLALGSLDIALHDHILVCDGPPQSFSRLGLLI